MSDRALVDRLDQTVDAVLARTDATAALTDPELAPLVRAAADLRHYPGADFKARLRTRLAARIAMLAAIGRTPVRAEFTTLTPYLRLKEPGLATFLQRVFDAVEVSSTTGAAGGVHREMRIGNSMVMIGEGHSEGVVPVRPVELHVYVEDADAVFERAIAAGATSLGAPADRPYGERSGFVKDAFGNHWFIATHLGRSHVPEGLRTVTPFVHARSAAAYITFLGQAFGAVAERRHDTPGGHVVYALLRVGDGAIELGEADTPAAARPGHFYLYVADVEAVYERALTAGARSLWAPTDQPYGERVAAIEDPWDSQWFIAGIAR